MNTIAQRIRTRLEAAGYYIYETEARTGFFGDDGEGRRVAVALDPKGRPMSVKIEAPGRAPEVKHFRATVLSALVAMFIREEAAAKAAGEEKAA